MKFLIINGPNLNLLGEREPDIYGKETLADIEKLTTEQLENHNCKCDCEWFQSNSEAEIIERIHAARKEELRALIINPAAFSHTSVAILDALSTLEIPVVEVHLSNTNRREDFRKVKITAKSSTGVVEGLGYKGYFLAILSQIL